MIINIVFNNHTIVNIIVGLLFGFKIGIIIGIIIQILSITICFYLSKYYLDKIKKITKRYNLDKYTKDESMYSIIISRLLPLPVNIVTFLWSVKNISYLKLLSGSLLGLLPWTIFEVYIGVTSSHNKKYIIEKLPTGLYIILFIIIYLILKNIYIYNYE